MTGSPAGVGELRNIAIIAHVDHGKTTLVDSMLRQSGAFGAREHVVERVLDSYDQERERGITIFAKQASVRWRHYKLNLVDTPGHADFSGEVERGLHLVDGVLLLVDAAEGPLPQTRYVLSKALARDLPAVVVLNKVDRSDARAEEVLEEISQLFLDLLGDDDHRIHHLDFPVISCVAREGRSVVGVGDPGPDDDLTALFEAIVKTIPAPGGELAAPTQALVANLDASEYLGRLAIGRVVNGALRRGEQVALLGAGGDVVRRKLTGLFAFDGLQRTEVEELGAGDLFMLSGFPEVEIGDTLADPERAVALPRLTVDEPVLTMTFGVNTSPMSGRAGQYLTSRHLRERLAREVLGNVALRVNETDSPDVLEVAGRGELQLAVLIEAMRREGYELQVSRPEVIVRLIDGVRHEPLERVIVDIPEDHVGTVTQAMAPRRSQLVDVRPGDVGRTILTFEGPSRGLLGMRSEVITGTRGTSLIHQRHGGWMPWVGDLPHRLGGAMIADRTGSATGYALDNLAARGVFFLEPGTEVYEGMIVGENTRADDMVVNVVREKDKTNFRTHSHDDTTRLPTPRALTLESAIEWIGPDELVEITPVAIRVRKRLLTEESRKRSRNRDAR